MARQLRKRAEPAAGAAIGGTHPPGLPAGDQQAAAYQRQAGGRDRQRDLPTRRTRRILGRSRHSSWRRGCAGRTGAITICGADGEDADRDGGAGQREQDRPPHLLPPPRPHQQPASATRGWGSARLSAVQAMTVPASRRGMAFSPDRGRAACSTPLQLGQFPPYDESRLRRTLWSAGVMHGRDRGPADAPSVYGY